MPGDGYYRWKKLFLEKHGREMIKTVLDANLFISAILKPDSNPAKIFELVKNKEVILFVSASILLEIRNALLYPKLQKLHQHDAEQIDFLLKEFTTFAEFTLEKVKIKAIKEDPADNKYLECAIEGKVDYIVSGDHHLKDLKNYHGILILAPAKFIKLFQ